MDDADSASAWVWTRLAVQGLLSKGQREPRRETEGEAGVRLSLRAWM